MCIINGLITIIFLEIIIPCISIGSFSQLISFQGRLEREDYFVPPPQHLSQYKLVISSDHIFQLIIKGQQQGNNDYILQGSAILDEQLSIRENRYLLQSGAYGQLIGDLSYISEWGICWSYNIQVKEIGLSLKRIEIRYNYLPIILLIMFGAAGLFVLPISDRGRLKILYNLRKRSHSFILMVILLKLLWVVGSFLSIAYGLIITLPIWSLLFIYGIYLFSLSPSLMHILYFFSAFQKNLLESSYRDKQMWIILGSISAIILTFIFSFYIHKGIFFYYILSINTFLMYAYSWKSKKFAFAPLIIYDILLTLLLSIFSLYYPISNFILVSYKEMILFWNMYILLFIFGIVFMKKLIRAQIVEEIQLQEYAMDVQAHIQNNNNINKTSQNLEETQ